MHDSVQCQAVATDAGGARAALVGRPRPRRAGTVLPRRAGGDGGRHRPGRRRPRVPRAQRPVGPRVGTMAVRRAGARRTATRSGTTRTSCTCAMWAQRFLAETGQGDDDLGAVAIAQRALRRRQRARGTPPSARPRTSTWRRRSWSSRSGRRLHRRGRRCLRARASRRSSGHATSPPAGGRRVRPRTAPDRDRASTSATTCSGTTTRATTPSLLRDELFARAGLAPSDVDARRDLRLLHEHGAHGTRGSRLLRARRVGRVRAQRRHPPRRRAPGQHARRAARPRATCTG